MDAAPSDEKGLLFTVKSEVIDTDMKSDISNFGVMLESPVQAFVNPSLPPAPLVPSGLQRYHSAPSSFLHSLNDDAFLQVSSPLDSSSNSRTSNSFIAPFFPEGLTAIIEQMENEKLGTSSTNLNEEFDPYIDAARHDYGKRAALSAAMLQTGKPETNWQVPTEAFIPDTFQSFFPALKNNLPAQLSAAAMQEVNERSPTGMAIQSMMSSEESMSGTSEDTNYGHGSKTPMYSRDDSFLLSDTSVNLPTSPGSMSGKRHRGVPGGGASTSGQIAEGSIRSRPGVAGSLTRHMSLPVGRTQMRPVGEDTSFLETVSGTRAKRGCATHPRSIAERVRRTRISERMKKLQGVVPNMDKQTNTSEMLDEAVEYIRSLQKKVQELTNIVIELRGQEYSRDDS
jgi:hypothetical protein